MTNSCDDYVKSFLDNKLPRHLEDLSFGPRVIRCLMKLFYLVVIGCFLLGLILFPFSKDGSYLNIFCFEHTNANISDRILLVVSGASASFDFVISLGHLLILMGLFNCPEKTRLFNLSRGTNNAFAVFSAYWIKQVSLSCASPDPEAHILDLNSLTFAKVVALLGSILGFLDLFVSNARWLPKRKAMKRIIRKISAVVQVMHLVTSLIPWIKEFLPNNPKAWILAFWWILRIAQLSFTEVCRFTRRRVKTRRDDQADQSDTVYKKA